MRYSPQREAILEIVQAHGGHLSVDEIYHAAKDRIPRISLGTVYRNLNQLEQMGKLSQMQGKQQSYFELHKAPHHHFVCNQCGDIQDLLDPSVSVCTGCIEKDADFQIESVTTTLYGTCAGCSIDKSE